VSENIAVIGATWDELEDYGDVEPRDNLNAGSAHVFERTGGTWIHRQTINAREPSEGGLFGTSVALADGVLLVGEIPYSDKGAVYVFTQSGDSWIQRQKISALDGTVFDAFGQSLCIHESTAFVGAPYHDYQDLTDPGAVFVLRLLSRRLPR
jgi:hypothetical protein